MHETSFRDSAEEGVPSAARDYADGADSLPDPGSGFHARPGQLRGGSPIDYARGLVMGGHRGLATIHHGGSLRGWRSKLSLFPPRFHPQ